MSRISGWGHFARHVRRMRMLYAERREALVEAIGRELAGLIEVGPVEAGLHLVGWLPQGTEDREASRKVAARGVEASPLALYGIETSLRPRLLLDYAAVGKEKIREGARRLAEALE